MEWVAKNLQRAVANANISGAELEAATSPDGAAEQCAANLMSRFNAMESKVGKKIG